MVVLASWPLRSAVIFGVLIAATDPVAVIAMFKDNGLSGRIRLLVESESLFNDGVAAVLFGLVLAWTQGEMLSPTHAALAMVLSAGGGVAIGLLCGSAAIVVAGRSGDHLVETVLSVAAAYGSFLLAEHFHASGVLATVATGILMGNFETKRKGTKTWLNPYGKEFLIHFWDFAAFLANSAVFLLIGLTVASLPFDHRSSITSLVAILLVLLGRFLSVYPICLLFLRSQWAVSLHDQHILWWGGLRGALALALALSLPRSLPMHGEIVLTTFGVAVFSIVVQGLTMSPLLRRLGYGPEKR
jgi:CPA1 family monovalent cation:H+ antiporter